MKKIMNKIKGTLFNLTVKAHVRAAREYAAAKSILRSQRAEGFVDTAIKILISVVIGALLLAGLYALFGETVLPTLKQRIVNMFNYGN